MGATPLCPTCDQPASEGACLNEACPEFGQPVAGVLDPASERRLAFAIPPVDEAALGVAHEWLDPSDRDDRLLLLEAAHPELGDDGEVNPRLHLAMHDIVAVQLTDNEPPEVWETAQRLLGLGYPRHEILHMLGSTMSTEIWHALRGDREYDRSAHLAALAALPESWERARPGGPSLPASRASHANDAQRRRKAARVARRKNRRR